MTRWFEAHTIARYGRYRQVEPTVVVEIAFDVIVRSRAPRVGFSLRFPRIHALRPDKSVDDIDTVATVTELYEGLQHGAELLVTASAKAVPRATVRDIPARAPHAVCCRHVDGFGGARAPSITLYTDEFVIRGSWRRRQRRVTDTLNGRPRASSSCPMRPFDEYGSRDEPPSAEFAQINLASVLFVVADDDIGADPALRTPAGRTGPDLGPAVPGHRSHPPRAGAEPARRAWRAPRTVPSR